MERIEKLSLSFLASIWPPDKDKKTLVFIHSAGTTALSWVLQLNGLQDKANIIAPDLPGHGKGKGSGMNSIKDYAGAVAGFLSELEIDNCIIIGATMGGAIVQYLLTQHIRNFRAAILINTGAKLKVLPAIFEAIKTDYAAFMIGMTDILFPASSGIKKIDSSLKGMLEIKQKVILEDFIACDKFDLRIKIGEINLPVLVISSKNDIMTPVWYGKYLHENIKKSELVIIEGAGHLSFFEKSDEVNSIMLKFIESAG